MTFDQRRLLKEALSAARLARQLQFDAELTVGDERDCELCHVTFVIQRGRQRFCCEKHRLTANRRTQTVSRSRAKARLRTYYEQREAA